MMITGCYNAQEIRVSLILFINYSIRWPNGIDNGFTFARSWNSISYSNVMNDCVSLDVFPWVSLWYDTIEEAYFLKLTHEKDWVQLCLSTRWLIPFPVLCVAEIVSLATLVALLPIGNWHLPFFLKLLDFYQCLVHKQIWPIL